jgi:hypothetical protein
MRSRAGNLTLSVGGSAVLEAAAGTVQIDGGDLLVRRARIDGELRVGIAGSADVVGSVLSLGVDCLDCERLSIAHSVVRGRITDRVVQVSGVAEVDLVNNVLSAETTVNGGNSILVAFDSQTSLRLVGNQLSSVSNTALLVGGIAPATLLELTAFEDGGSPFQPSPLVAAGEDAIRDNTVVASSFVDEDGNLTASSPLSLGARLSSMSGTAATAVVDHFGACQTDPPLAGADASAGLATW